jgi:putative tryptophan/tyrosine transport system substrate-binding protein
MRRRDFITLLGGVAAVWPLPARAQQAVHLIGFLVSGAPDSFAIFVDAFKQGMFDNGLVEGRDYVLDLRFAEGNYDRFDTHSPPKSFAATPRLSSSRLSGRRKRLSVQPQLSR